MPSLTIGDRETRLRTRIDELRDLLDCSRLRVAQLTDRVHELERAYGHDVQGLRARLRFVKNERDEALAELWRARDKDY